jgi:hypothetical protein
MANTYEAIATVTVGGGGAASIEFTSIPQTGYTDLVVKVSARESSGNNWFLTIFNGDTASNYTQKNLYGNGSTAGSIALGPRANFYIDCLDASPNTANTFSSMEFYIPNYTSSNAKSMSFDGVMENNTTSINAMGLWAGLWSGTAAINSITLTQAWAANSTATLYGISNS